MIVHSIVSSPDPTRKRREKDLVNLGWILYGVCRQGQAKLGSDWSLWHVIATGGRQTLLNLIVYIAYTAIQRCCIPVVSCHVTEQSCNLIGTWKFLSEGPRILPKCTMYQTLFLLGGGVWGRDYAYMHGTTDSCHSPWQHIMSMHKMANQTHLLIKCTVHTHN